MSNQTTKNLFQRMSINWRLVEVSEAEEEKQYFTVVFRDVLTYGTTFQCNYSHQFLDLDDPYLDIHESLRDLINEHAAGRKRDYCFSRLVNQLLTFADIRGFRVELPRNVNEH